MLWKLFHEKGRSDIDIVGVGGIGTGKDAFELILCGASAVQVGTCHWIEGPICFARIAGELEAIMKRKGYTSIADFKGKLRPYVKPPIVLAKPEPKGARFFAYTMLYAAIIVSIFVTVAIGFYIRARIYPNPNPVCRTKFCFLFGLK